MPAYLLHLHCTSWIQQTSAPAAYLEVVIASGRGVGGSEDGGSRVEHRGDARLGNADGLLLHGLVDGHPAERRAGEDTRDANDDVFSFLQ